MGNKEFRDGFFSVNDGISLLKFPTVDAVRVVFLILYEEYAKNSKTYASYHQQYAKISLGDKEKG